jgi:hypothetical protein
MAFRAKYRYFSELTVPFIAASEQLTCDDREAASEQLTWDDREAASEQLTWDDREAKSLRNLSILHVSMQTQNELMWEFLHCVSRVS